MTIIKETQKFISYVGDTFQINFELNGLQIETGYNVHFMINSNPVIEYSQEITSDTSGAADVSFFVKRDDTAGIKAGLYTLGLKLCTGQYSDTVYKQNIQFLARVAGNNCND